MPKQKKPSSSSKATEQEERLILSDGTRAKALRGRLTLEEQRALGIDTGPVLIVSPVARRPKPPKLPEEEA